MRPHPASPDLRPGRGRAPSLRRLCSLLALALFPLLADAATAIRLHVGGASYTDSSANAWSADSGAGGGSALDWGSVPIAGTADPALFRTERYGSALNFAFAVPNGSYQVRLYFAENYVNASWPSGGVGFRRFNVLLENAVVDPDVDIMALVGARTALVRTYTVTVSDGQLNLALTALANNALINAIEITDTGPPPPPDTTPPSVPTGVVATALNSTTVSLAWNTSTDSGTGLKEYHVSRNGTQVATVSAGTTSYTDIGLSANSAYVYTVSAADLANPANESAASAPANVSTPPAPAGTAAVWRIHAGGAAFTDVQGNSWSADTLFNTGVPVDWGSVGISGAADSRIYQSERYDPAGAPELQYDLPVANGTYTVRLHFAENYISNAWPNGGVGARVFSVQAEGATVLPNVDIVALAGIRAALVRTFSVTVTDGVLSLRFVHGIENPLINGIEVLATADTTPPTVPGGLTATAQGTTSVLLSWSASSDAGTGVGGYRIWRNGTAVGTATGTTYTDTGLAPATTYVYSVSAFDLATPANESATSGTASATTLTPADTTPPTVPTGLAAAAQDSSTIQLSWSASTDSGTGVAGYRIRRNGTVIGTSTGTGFTDTGLAPATAYSYTVSAFDGATPANESQPSVSAGASTPADLLPPDAPTGVTATAQSSSSIRLSWTAPADPGGSGIGGYRIQRDGVLVTTTTATSYLDTGLAPLTGYGYTVIAFDRATPANVSSPSAGASATTLPDTTAPTVPTGLSAATLGTTSIRLTWNTASDAGTGVGGYILRRDGVSLPPVTGTTFTDTGLTPGTTYAYTISAFDLAVPANESATSASVSAATQAPPDLTPPTIPSQLRARVEGSSSVLLHWRASTDAASGVGGYRIYRDGVSIGTSTVAWYVDGGLAAASTHVYKITAFDRATPANESDATAEVTATTDTARARIFFRFPYTAAQWAQAGLAPAGSLVAPQYNLGDVDGQPATPGLGANIAAAQALGLRVVGHVDGSDSALPRATIKARIDRWYADFPEISGIYVGNAGDNGRVADGVTYAAYWAEIGDYIRSKGGIAVIHPGGSLATEQDFQTLLQSFSTEVLYEDYLPHSGGVAQLPALYGWMGSYAASRFAALANGVTMAELLDVQAALLARNVGYLYLTAVDNQQVDDDDYWASELIGLVSRPPRLVDTVAPSVPTALSATAQSSTQINLTWTAASDGGTGVAGYQVWRGATQVGSSTTTRFADTGLAPGTTYTYSVTAFDGAVPVNVSSPSDTATATTLTPDTTPPTVPGTLSGFGYNSTSIALAWGASTDAGTGLGGYRLYRDDVLVATVDAGTLSYRDIGIAPGSTHTYSVTAIDLEGPPNESAHGNAVTVGTLPDSSGTALYRINVGGPAFTDSQGNAWSADARFNTGTTVNWGAAAISGTADPTIYRSERYDPSSGAELQYDLPVPNGTYLVRLHFAENYVNTTWPNGGVGARVFDVQAQGVTVIAGLDVLAAAGPRAALIRALSVTVSNGVLSLRFVHVNENPLVNGIEVIAEENEAPTYNVGFRVVTYASGRKAAVWYPTLDAPGVATYANGLGSDYRLNAAQVAGKSFPLLLYSHGDGNCSIHGAVINEQLARNGFIVAAPDHADATCSADGTTPRGPEAVPYPAYASPALWSDTTGATRRDDIRTLTDYLLADATFAPRIDTARIGLVGYSLGGYTALGLVGGWSGWRDTRFKAALLLSPYTSPFIDRATLGAITVPLMYQGGTLDDFMTPYLEGPVAPYTTGAFAASGTPKYFAKLNGAAHTEWTVQACATPGTANQCLLDQPLVGVMATYAVAFFNQQLLGVTQPLLHVSDAMFSGYQYAD